MKTVTKLWLGIGVLILLSPMGLLLPEHFKSGDAWGEWSTGTFKGLIGYIPQGMEKLSRLWRAPVSNYAFKGWEEKGLGVSSFGYIVSAVIGILLVVGAALFIGKILTRKK